MKIRELYQRVVEDGYWLYDETARKPLYIIEQNYDYWFEMEKADGELEEGSEPGLNAEGVIYYVRMRPMPDERPWGVDSPGHASVEEAKEWAEEKLESSVFWLGGSMGGG